MLVHPDGTRSLIPASWTDLVPESSTTSAAHEGKATLASVAQLLRTRVVVDALLRRVPAVPSDRSQPEVSTRGYSNHDAIDQATAAGVTVYAPVPKPRGKASEPPDPSPIDPHLPRPSDSDAGAAGRGRMGTDSAKQIYKQRAATAETVNADAKAHRGMADIVLEQAWRLEEPNANPATSCSARRSSAPG